MHHIEPVKLKLFVFHIDELAREEQIAIKGHLGICPLCRREADNLRRQSRSIRRNNAAALRSTDNFTAADKSCIRLFPHSSSQLVNPAFHGKPASGFGKGLHTVALFVGRIDELYLRVQQYGTTPRYSVHLLTPAFEKYRYCKVYFPQLQVVTELDTGGKAEFVLKGTRAEIDWAELLCLLKICEPAR